MAGRLESAVLEPGSLTTSVAVRLELRCLSPWASVFSFVKQD